MNHLWWQIAREFGTSQPEPTPDPGPTAVIAIADFTQSNGLYRDTAATSPVTAYGQTVERIIIGDLDAELVGDGTVTWTADGLVVSGDARMDLAASLEVYAVVAAATPSTGDTNDWDGLLGDADHYLTIGADDYRWREPSDTSTSIVPGGDFHQVGSFNLSSGDLTVWMNGIEGETKPKGPLTISRLFHRTNTITWNGTVSYLAIFDDAISDADREAYQSSAAATFWPLRTEDFLATPKGVPLRVERLNAGDAAEPMLVSFHGVSGKGDGDAYSGHSDFLSTYDLPAFHPWFRNPPWLKDYYQLGGRSDIAPTLIASCRTELGDATRSAILFGYSAGGQWLSRVMAYNPPSQVQRAVISAPSTWVFPDDRAGPYGFGDYAEGATRNDAIAAYLAREICVYVGTEDNDPNSSSLDTSADAMLQGDHRRERAENVFAAAQDAATALGVPCNWELVYASGVGHSGSGMLRSADAASAFFGAQV